MNNGRINFMRPFHFFTLTVVIISALIFSNGVHADSYSNTIDLFKKSPAVQPFFDNSYGYVVFPTVGNGGYFFGGAYGEGMVYRQGNPTGTSRLVKATIGFQAGGKAFSEIIFLQDKRAYDEFILGNFELDATASFVVITAGAHVKFGTEGVTAGASAGPATGAQTKTNYRKGIAVFIHDKGGLMYEVAIGGQTFSFEPKK